MINLNCSLKRSKRNADESVDLVLETMTVITSERFGQIDSHRGDVCMVVLTDSTIGNDIPDFDIEELLKQDQLIYDNKKSYSQRFRNVLYKLLEEKLGRKPSTEEFADFYKSEYEKILSHYKEKFNN